MSIPHHVFETNWVVAYAVPAHHRQPVAEALVGRAAKGEIVLHVPSVCLREGENAITQAMLERSLDLRAEVAGT